MNEDATGTRREHAVALLWFALAAAIFLAPLFGGKSFSVVGSRQNDVYPWAAQPNGEGNPAQFDSADLSYPWQLELSGALDDGTLAFWTPEAFGGGAPLYANGTSGQLYPPRAVITAVAPERWAHDLYVAFHLVVGGFVAYLLCRELRISTGGAVVAGTAWMLGSFNLAWVHLEVVTSMLVALPLAPLVVHRMWRRQSSGSLVLAAVAFAAMLISGHLLWQGLIWMVGAVYAASLGLRSAWNARREGNSALMWRQLWRPPAAFGLGAVLSAVVLLPTAINLARTPRSPFVTEALPSYLASARTFTVELFTGPSFAVMDTDVMNYRLAFVGTITAALALIGLFTRREGSAFARTLMIVTAGVAVIGPLARIAYELVPGMNVFYPYARLAGWFALGAIVAAGIGFDTLIDAVQRARAPAAGARATPGWATAALAASIAAITVIQLVPLGRDLNPPFQPRSDPYWFPETPLVSAVHTLAAGNPAGTRVAAVVLDGKDFVEGGPAIFRSNHPGVLGIDSTSGYDSTLPEPAAQALRAIAGEEIADVLDNPLVGAFVPNFEVGSTRFDMLRSQGVSAVVTVPEIDPLDPELEPLEPYEVVYEGDDGNLLALEGVDGIVSMHDDVVVLRDDEDVLRELALTSQAAGFPVLTTEEAVDDSGIDPDLLDADTSNSASEASVTEKGQNSIEVSVTTEGPSWLLLAVNDAPGWSATIGGDDAPILQANHSHMAVRVERTADVTLRYRPPGLGLGLGLSLAGAVLCLALLAPRRGGRKG